jgi:tRNA threonylcarbamoyladenosine biosynthesis protein TsaE
MSGIGMSASRELHLSDADATAALAAALAATAPSPAVVHLQGDLGAGKSTLARAWLRALGVQGAIRSPTYTLVERYPLAGGDALPSSDLRIALVIEGAGRRARLIATSHAGEAWLARLTSAQAFASVS